MIKSIKKAKYLIYFLTLLGFLFFIHYQYKSWYEQRLLRLIPFELQVSKILYANTESWGFGPGGNETGIIVYELPDKVAHEIQKVLATKVTQEPGAFSDFRNWKQTPIPLTDEWQGSRSGSEPEQNIQFTKIANYLDRWSFSVSIDPKIESEIDYAITRSGSYYLYGRTGITIVIPNSKKVIFAYAG